MNDNTYPLHSFNKIQISSAAKKSLIAAEPHYFAWSPEKQEHFRATMSRDARKRAQKVLLNSLLNIPCSIKNVDDVWDDVPKAELNILNWANLLITGIGKDYIYLNQPMAEGKSLLDFTTLYDYDYDDYLYQEQAKRRDFENYKGADYFAWQHPSWVRLLINEQFYYANFLSLATHFINLIESAGDNLIDELIPHDYVRGKDDGKPQKGGFLWDIKIDANGYEGQLEELKHRWHHYQYENWFTLSKRFSQLPPAVYVYDEKLDNDDPHRSFVFNNAEVLHHLRWRYFLSDCEPFRADYSTLTTELAQAIEQTHIWITDNHIDVMNNFDPNVVKLRKKRKIIMAPGALDDLSTMTDDE